MSSRLVGVDDHPYSRCLLKEVLQSMCCQINEVSIEGSSDSESR